MASDKKITYHQGLTSQGQILFYWDSRANNNSQALFFDIESLKQTNESKSDS